MYLFMGLLAVCVCLSLWLIYLLIYYYFFIVLQTRFIHLFLKFFALLKNN